jgi:fibronectin-binding autotransporter adhesin
MASISMFYGQVVRLPSSRRGRCGLLVILIISLVAANMSFQPLAWGCSWNLSPDQTGDWSTAANWGGSEPTSSTDASIVNGGTAIVTQPAEACSSLYLGGTGTGRSGTVQMNGGSLSATTEYVGYTSTGLFTQWGGTHTVTTHLYLGSLTGSDGTYNLNGGTLITRSINTGSGTATFNFGGGTLKASSSLSTTLAVNLSGVGGNANVDTSTYTTTLSGTLSGAGGLNKLGAGSLILSGSNSYGGTTNVNGGVLTISSTTALPGWDVAGLYSVASGAGLTVGDVFTDANIATMLATGNFSAGSAIGFDNASTRTFNASTLPAGVGLAKSGIGTLNLSATLPTTSGAVIVTAGTLNLGGFSHATSGNISFLGGTVQNGTLRKAGGAFDAQAGTINAVLGDGSAAARLTKSGTGLLTLTAANTFSGGTTLNDGTLVLAPGDNRLSNTGAITVLGGILDLRANSQETAGNISIQGGVVQIGTLKKNGGNFDLQAGTVSANLADGSNSAGLIKTGAGTALLTGTNTYSGNTIVSAGTLSISSTEALPGWNTAGKYTVASGAVLAVGDAVTAANIGNMLATGNFIAASAIGFDVSSSRTFDCSTLPTTMGLAKIGTGTLTLANTALTTTGDITVGAGTLDLGGFWHQISGKVSIQGGTVQNGKLLKNGGYFDVTGGTISAWLANGTSPAGLIKSGSGVATISYLTTYTGGTTISAGTLSLSGSGQLPSAGSITVTGGVLDLGGHSQSTSGAVSFQGGVVQNGSISKFGSGDYDAQSGTISASLTGSVGLTKTGAGTLILSGSNFYSGATNILDGTLQVAASLALPSGTAVNLSPGATLDLNYNSNFYVSAITGAGTVAVNKGALTVTCASRATLDATITGPGEFVMGGAGTLELTTANTYSGITRVSGGTLRLSKPNALPGGTGATGGTSSLLLCGGTVELAAGNFTRAIGTGPEQVYFSNSTGGGFSAAGADRTVNIGGASAPLTWGSTNFINFGYYLTLASPTADATLDFQNPIDFGTNPNQGGLFYVNDGAAAVDAVLSGSLSGAGLLSKGGSGTLLLTGSNSYTGTTGISGGTLRIGVDGALPAASTSLYISGGTLDLNGYSHTFTNLTATAGAIALGGATLTLSPTSNVSLGASVTGPGTLIKSGTGNLLLNATNSYVGPTIFSGGILQLQYAASLPGGIGATGGTSNLLISGGIVELYGSGFSFLRGLGAGPDQIQFTSSGGFSAYGSSVVNLGGNAAAVTWGQDGFIPDGCSLTLSLSTSMKTLDFQNPINLGSQIRTVEVNRGLSSAPAIDAILSGNLGGNGGLNKIGWGILALTGGCSYSGGTTISAGTLYVGNGGTTGNLGGNVLNQGTLIFNHSNLYTFNGSISGPGTVQIGLGTVDGKDPVPVVLAAANTYTGATKVMKSILRLADPQAVPGGIGATGGLSNLMVCGDQYGNSGSIVELASNDFLRGLGTGPDQVQFLSAGGFSAFGGPRSVNLGGASATITWGSGGFVPSGSALIFSSAYATDTVDFRNSINLNGAQTIQVNDGAAAIDAKLSGLLSFGSLTKTGPGALALSLYNTYTGTTTVSQGVLQLTGPISLPGGCDRTGGISNLTLAGGVVDLAGGNFYRSLGTGPDQVQFAYQKGGGFSASGGTRIVNFGGLYVAIALSNTFPLIFGSSIADSTLEFQNRLNLSNVNTTIQVNDGAAPVDARLTGIINSTGGGIEKTGSGTLELTAANTFTGPLFIYSGAVRLSNSLALPGGTGAGGGTSNLILDGGVLELAAGNFMRSLGTTSSQVQFSEGGGFSAAGANRVVNLGGANAQTTWGGGQFVPAGQPLILGSPSADATLDFQNPIDLGSVARTIRCDNGSASVDGQLSGILSGAGGGLTVSGLGTLALSADNTYTGLTTISSGVLELASTGQIAASSGVSTALAATFRVDGGTHTVASISGAGSMELINQANLTVNSIAQGTLTLGPGSTLTIAALPGGPLAYPLSPTPVPEPSAFILLGMGAIALLGYAWQVRKHAA